MRADLVQDALAKAISLRGDLPEKVVCHSDRGTQYASEQITALAAANGWTRSMGFTGTCWDNAMAESFFATLKTEFYYPACLANQEGGPDRGRSLDRGPVQPPPPARITGPDQPRDLRTATLTPDRGRSKSRIARVH